MVNHIFKYHEVTLTQFSFLNLVLPPRSPHNVCHKLPAIGMWGNDHKLIFNATVTSRMPRKAGIECQILVMDQMARVRDNEHGLKPSTG